MEDIGYQRGALTYRGVILVTAVLIGLSSLDVAIAGLRYVKYCIAPLLLILWLARPVKNYSHKKLFGFLILLLYGGFSLLWGDLAYGGKDIVFISSYVIPVILFYTNSVKVEGLFKIYSIFFLVSIIFKDVGSFSISDSSALFEGSESFVFGAFAVSFMLKRNHLYLILSLFLMMLTLKRIAMLGVIACFAIWALPVYLRKFLISVQGILAINISALAFIFPLSMGYFNDIIVLITEKSASAFTLGRISHYKGVVEAIIDNPGILIYGAGAGAAYEKAVLYYTGEYANLHSDTLKILYEYGALFFLAFFTGLKNLKSDESRIFIIYLAVLFISDNVLIYAGVMFFILYIMLSHESGSEN